MKPKITIVVDRDALEFGARKPNLADRWAERWHISDLARSLQQYGADAAIFWGALSEAPPSWAYVLLTAGLDVAGTSPGTRARFPRTIGLISIREACRDADRFGLAGAINELGVPDPETDTPETRNRICVKRTVAEQLGWETTPIDSSQNFASIMGLPIPIGQLILTYLRALIGDPAEASPPSPPAP